MFWHEPGQRIEMLQAEYPNLEVVYTTDDGSFGIKGFVTTALESLLEGTKDGFGSTITEVVTIGPPLMMRSVSELTRSFGVRTIASLNSIMIDATGMCGACMVPVRERQKLLRKHACIDGPELDAHTIDWDKYLPRFQQFRAQEEASLQRHGFA